MIDVLMDYGSQAYWTVAATAITAGDVILSTLGENTWLDGAKQVAWENSGLDGTIVPGLVEAGLTIGREVGIAYLTGGTSLAARTGIVAATIIRGALVGREVYEGSQNFQAAKQNFNDGNIWGGVYHAGLMGINVFGAVTGTGRAFKEIKAAMPASRVPVSFNGSNLPILNSSFTPKAPLNELILEQAKRRGFGTGQSEALFYSGLGTGKTSMLNAQRFAAANGGKTIEMTAGGKYLHELDLYGANPPLPSIQADSIWAEASRAFASNASGQVRSVTGTVRPNSIWNTVELPTLMANPNIWGIDVLNLLPRIGLR